MTDDDNEPQMIDMLGGRLERVARLSEPQDAVLFRTSMVAGELVPLHSHVDPECFYVLSGQLEVFLDDDGRGWRAIEAGRSLLVSDGVRHAVRNPGDREADLIVVTNNRLADFFREAGRPVTPGAPSVPASPAEFARVAKTAEKFGYWLATPDENASVSGTP